MDRFVFLGEIVNTHGLKGEVRVKNASTDPDASYQPGRKVYLTMEKGADPLELTIKSHRPHKNFELLTFEGYTNINQVEAFKKGYLYMDEEDLPDLEDNEIYVRDLIGFDVQEEGQSIGKIKDVLTAPANDVWIVQRDGKQDLLLPNIPSVILDVDKEAGLVQVHVLEGLDPDED